MRLETAYPAYRERAVLQALLSSHPYDEPAYDIYDLRNPEPTYGVAHFGILDRAAPEGLVEQVRAAAGAKAVRRAQGHKGSIARVLVLGDPRGVPFAAAEAPDAVVSPPLLPWDAANLRSAGCMLVEGEDFLPLVFAQFSGRLRAEVQAEVRFAPEGFTWRRLRSRDGTKPS